MRPIPVIQPASCRPPEADIAVHAWARLRQPRVPNIETRRSPITRTPTSSCPVRPIARRRMACKPDFVLPHGCCRGSSRRLLLDRSPPFTPPDVSPSSRSRPSRGPCRLAGVIYAKRPFVGPEAALAYLARYTHRVAISSSRLIACDDNGVTFRRKNYRARGRAAVRPSASVRLPRLIAGLSGE